MSALSGLGPTIVVKRFVISGPDLEGDLSLLLTSKAREFGLEIAHTFKTGGCEVVVRGPEDAVISFWRSLAESDLPPRKASISKLEDPDTLHRHYGISSTAVKVPDLGSFTERYAYGAVMTVPRKRGKKKAS